MLRGMVSSCDQRMLSLTCVFAVCTCFVGFIIEVLFFAYRRRNLQFADDLYTHSRSRLGPTYLKSVLIWIQPICHYDILSERIVLNVILEKKISRRTN